MSVENDFNEMFGVVKVYHRQSPKSVLNAFLNVTG